MKIAIIGSGISGLTCAWHLSRNHEVHVFEANDYLGGHTHTVDVETSSGRYAIDTGFIVFNDWTYPEFIKLMNSLSVKWKDSSMSFSVKAESIGLEYNGTSINSLFAQRKNLFSLSFHRMIQDIFRFNRESLAVLDSPTSQTLGEYLKAHHYSKAFKEFYIIPMGAAIWSSSVAQMDEFPVEYFVRFFKNHGMLSVSDRPVWKVIEGGSRSYLEPIIRPFKKNIHLNAPVHSVKRSRDQVVLSIEERGKATEAYFDEVILASHSNQSLKILEDPTAIEREILSAFQYQSNETILHTDENVLPKKIIARAAWNYFVPRNPQHSVSVTYIMNILQGFSSPETFSVSLNMGHLIEPSKIIRKFNYDHPVFNRNSFQAQNRWSEISGKNRTHFCGAYWGYGFHEDGVKSGLRVCKTLGALE